MTNGIRVLPAIYGNASENIMITRYFLQREEAILNWYITRLV